MTIISERLQHLRLTHGYTQTDLAQTMGVTRRAVYALSLIHISEPTRP